MKVHRRRPWEYEVRRRHKRIPALIATLTVLLTLGVTGTALADTGGWQSRTIPTPADGRVPTFVSADGGLIAWTGASGSDSKTYLYDLSTGLGKEVSALLPGSYYNPDIDGNLVVFQGKRPGAYDDIYLYKVDTRVRSRITDNTRAGDADDWNPRVQGGRIVWEKNMTGLDTQPGIYLYDAASGATRVIISGDAYREPDIYGDYVVCVEDVTAEGTVSSRIVLYNLATMQTTPLTDGSTAVEHPRIHEGKIVWSQGQAWSRGASDLSGTYQIVLYDIAAGTATPLTNNTAGNVAPSIDGSYVAWKTRKPASVVVHDLATGTSLQPGLQGDTVDSVDMDGTMAVWSGQQGLHTAVSAADATRFMDVPRVGAYYDAIEGMAASGIINGYADGYFKPADPVTRQQFAKMIVLTMGIKTTLDDEYSFRDADDILHTPGQLYAYHYVAKAALTGLAPGYSDGTFRPSSNITRAQLISMVVRAGQHVLNAPDSGYKGVLPYNDATHGQNIRMAEFNNLLDGIVGPRGTLTGWSTGGNATRAEACQILWNLRGLLR